MGESTVALLIQAGAVGIALALVGLLYFTLKGKKDSEESDRLVLTNHLSGLLKDDIESRKQLTIALTTLNSTVSNSTQNCSQIQKDMQKANNDMQKTNNDISITQKSLNNEVEQLEELVKKLS